MVRWCKVNQNIPNQQTIRAKKKEKEFSLSAFICTFAPKL